MIEEIKYKFPPSQQAPVAKINLVEPNHCLDSGKCEVNMHIGLFFDGTNNNSDTDKPKMGHSNIVRLFDAYPDKPDDGMFHIYVPGVGTEFLGIGEIGKSKLGNAFAIGSEGRVVFGLLQLFNMIYLRAFKIGEVFTENQVLALCRDVSSLMRSSKDNAELKKMGLNSGLLMPSSGDGLRESFLKKQAGLLEQKMTEHGKPDVKECFVDVFGFSRGAAEARVFCQWMDQLLSARKLAGVIIRLRFVGLMDSVASAGFWSGIGGGIGNTTHGHGGWAAPQNMLIPGIAENCVHMVAMHELRKNFPLDEIGIDGVLPPNSQQFAYPGAHSDVGGGYDPEELGISVGKTAVESDALKLSQIPLNHMLACAIAAGVPLNKDLAIDTLTKHDPFAIDPRVQQAFNDFLTTSTMVPRPLHGWSQQYLTWRWQVRKTYLSLGHVRKANEKDKKLLIAANELFMDDAKLITGFGDVGLSQQFLDAVTGKRQANMEKKQISHGKFGKA